MTTTTQIEILPDAWTVLENSLQWRALTLSQKSFVTVFLVTGDPIAATRFGYSPKSEQNCRVMSYELLANSRIASALAVATGQADESAARQKLHADKKRLLHEVCRHLAKADDGSVAASKLLRQKDRLIQEIAELLNPKVLAAKAVVKSGPDEFFAVGDVVRQAGVLYRVNAVDADGRITNAEEVEEDGI
jgi:hypothetical protein